MQLAAKLRDANLTCTRSSEEKIRAAVAGTAHVLNREGEEKEGVRFRS